MGAGDILDSSLVNSQSFFTTFSSISYWAVFTYPFIYAFIPPFVNWTILPSQFLTLIRSRRREDLNIQSSLISSLLSRSSRLPLVQCSVTMPNMPVSKNRPRNRFRFSWRMSLSYKEWRGGQADATTTTKKEVQKAGWEGEYSVQFFVSKPVHNL